MSGIPTWSVSGGTGCQVVCWTGLYTFGILQLRKIDLLKTEKHCLYEQIKMKK